MVYNAKGGGVIKAFFLNCPNKAAIRILCLIAGILCSSTQADNLASSTQKKWNVITFGGNSAAWNEKLALSGVRMGCHLEPLPCIKRASAMRLEQHVEYINLSIAFNEYAPSYAKDYSRLSVSNSVLQTLSIDDFVSSYGSIYRKRGKDASFMLEKMVNNIKSENKILNFGVTIYETDLSSKFLKSKYLGTVGGKVDYVYFYLHHRQNYKLYGQYIEKIREIFPFAKIVAGSYAYDRVDYIACAQNEKKKCSQQEDITLFEKKLMIDVNYLSQGVLDGIEFYPAFFGMEEKWTGWDKPKLCSVERRDLCIQNTKVMRDSALRILNNALNDIQNSSSTLYKDE